MKLSFSRWSTCLKRKTESETRALKLVELPRHRGNELFFEMHPKRCLHSRKYLSRMLINTGKPQPKDSDLACKSHKLLIYNDIISPSHNGAFHLLPFGQRALEKLILLIDDEMQAIGCEKISLSTLTPKHLWMKTGRWDLMGPELFRIHDRHDGSYCLGPTHEEAVTEMITSQSPLSYKRFPLMIYQITRKFRDEMAPKHGLLRGREFEMKDLYTFDTSEENAKETYDKVNKSYCNIFNRLNLKYLTVAGDSGAIGGDLSHEFHIPSEIGQDKLLLCTQCSKGWNQELIDVKGIQKCERVHCGPSIEEQIGIEVGHTFYLGTKYSKPMNANYMAESGKPELLQMGCYGLGVTRILQAGIEVLSLDNQIRWPSLLAPYQVVIIPQKEGYKADVCFEMAERLSDKLSELSPLKSELVIDDRTFMSIGKRIYEAKRLGFPFIVVLGKTVLESPALYEVIDLSNDQTSHMTEDQLIDRLSTVQTISLKIS